MSLPASGDGFAQLQRALEPLVEGGFLVYLPSYECCGSCGWSAISQRDAAGEFGNALGVATFNEQTAEKASASNIHELLLSLSHLDGKGTGHQLEDGSLEDLVSMVRKALLEAGYEERLFDGDSTADIWSFTEANHFALHRSPGTIAVGGDYYQDANGEERWSSASSPALPAVSAVSGIVDHPVFRAPRPRSSEVAEDRAKSRNQRRASSAPSSISEAVFNGVPAVSRSGASTRGSLGDLTGTSYGGSSGGSAEEVDLWAEHGPWDLEPMEIARRRSENI